MKPLARGAWVISNWWGSFLKNNNSIQTFFFFHHHHVNTLSSSFCGDFKFITAFFLFGERMLDGVDEIRSPCKTLHYT
jgi:hypothetical protein